MLFWYFGAGNTFFAMNAAWLDSDKVPQNVTKGFTCHAALTVFLLVSTVFTTHFFNGTQRSVGGILLDPMSLEDCITRAQNAVDEWLLCADLTHESVEAQLSSSPVQVTADQISWPHGENTNWPLDLREIPGTRHVLVTSRDFNVTSAGQINAWLNVELLRTPATTQRVTQLLDIPYFFDTDIIFVRELTDESAEPAANHALDFSAKGLLLYHPEPEAARATIMRIISVLSFLRTALVSSLIPFYIWPLIGLYFVYR